jgi:uncharacterized protein involved in exopolysaccharide biosynthesis
MPEELQLIPRSLPVHSPTLRDLAAVFFRHGRLWMLTFVVVLAGIILYGVLCPSYRAEMKIFIRRGRTAASATPTVVQGQQFGRQDIGEEDINSEVELLRDRETLARAVQSSGLADAQGWTLVPAQTSAARREERAVLSLSSRLNVEPVRKTTLIAVSYASSDPQQAARVLRCLADAYMQRHVQVRRPSGESEFFQQQLEASQQELSHAQDALMQFTRDRGVVAAAMERDTALQRLSQDESDFRQTSVALAATAKRIITLQNKLQSLPERTTTLIRNSDNPLLLEKVKSRLLELQLKRTELLTKYEPGYRLVQEVDQQIAQAKAALAAEDQAPLRDETTDRDPDREWAQSELIKAQVEFNALQARAASMRGQLASSRNAAQKLGDRAVQQQELLRDLKIAEDKYLLYANKREEARIGDALEQSRILDVSLAEQPTVPALPSRSFFALGAIGLALAGTCSTGLVFARDYLDPAFRTPNEVIAYLGMPVLASLPPKDV